MSVKPPSPGIPCTFIPGTKLIVSALCAATLAQGASPVWAQPAAIEPYQIQRLHRETHFSSNWSETDQFDLENPIELVVTLQGIDLPTSPGEAHILFTMDIPQSLLDDRSLGPNTVFTATMQTAGEARRLKLNRGRLGKGRQAILRGWPPSASNNSASLMLVDEVELLHNGKIISLHHPNPKMKKKPK